MLKTRHNCVLDIKISTDHLFTREYYYQNVFYKLTSYTTSASRYLLFIILLSYSIRYTTKAEATFRYYLLV